MIQREMIRIASYLGMTKSYNYGPDAEFPIYAFTIFDQIAIFCSYKEKELTLWLGQKELSMSIDDLGEQIIVPALRRILSADLAFIHDDYT